MTIKKENLEVVILAGGYGTRLSEYTREIPKPMVKINKAIESVNSVAIITISLML